MHTFLKQNVFNIFVLNDKYFAMDSEMFYSVL